MRRIQLLGLMIAAVLWMVATSTASPQRLSATQVFGGPGGESFSDFQPPADASVVEVRIRSGEMIDSVQMVYGLRNGRTVTGPRHGGPGGNLNSFRLDRDEYIVGLSGRHGKYLDSLRFITNKRTSPTYGGDGGDGDYDVEVPSGSQAVGFTGRTGQYVDAIGLVYAPFYTPDPPSRRDVAGPMGARPGRVQETDIAGGGGGNEFADYNLPGGSRIAEIRIRSGQRIDSLQIVYRLPNGRLQDGPRRGGDGGNLFVIRFEADEYLTGISGRAGQTVDSLRIITNKRTSLTFGGRGGDRDFNIGLPRGAQAIGFAGRAGAMLDAIGLTYLPGATGRRLPRSR
jgi:hypothetical protein